MKFLADLNPAYPSKGQLRYVVYAKHADGARFEAKQFRSLQRANEYAYKREVQYERSHGVPYLGD
jgi:hypothetical protein